MAMASAVLIRVTPSAPAASAAPAISARSATVGLSLAHSGQVGARSSATAASTSAVAAGEWANIWRRSSMFGTAHVDLDGGQALDADEQRRGLGEVVDPLAPDADHDPGPGGGQPGQVVARSTPRCPDPGAPRC